MDFPIDILGEVTLSEQGNYRYVRRWIRGWHPSLGQLIWGITGKETVVEVGVLRPTVIYEVKSNVFPIAA